MSNEGIGEALAGRKSGAAWTPPSPSHGDRGCGWSAAEADNRTPPMQRRRVVASTVAPASGRKSDDIVSPAHLVRWAINSGARKHFRGRRYQVNLVKGTYLYEPSEIAKLFDVHRNTIRHWLKEGLKPIDDRRPIL